MQLQESPIPLERPELCWHTISVPPGQSLQAWTAGPSRGFTVHQLGKITKPCIAKVTNGYLGCEWCGICRTSWKAYYPLFTCERPIKQVVVMFSKTAMRQIGYLKQHTPVRVTNPGTKDHRPVMMTCDTSIRSEELSKIITRRHPVDIVPYLLNLWQHEKLAAWAGYPLRAGEGGLRCGELQPTELRALMENEQPVTPTQALNTEDTHDATTTITPTASATTNKDRKRKAVG